MKQPRSFFKTRPILLLSMVLMMASCGNEGTEEKKEGSKEPKSSYSSAKERKLAFFEKLYPIVKDENERIMKERDFLLRMLEKVSRGNKISDTEGRKLRELARKYRVAPPKVGSKEGIEELDRKIGRIPPRLAMIQAANESNWGRSRFAKQGNNLFGQWCFTKGCGIVPKKRASGAKHEVASFSSISMSVRAYLLNLNSHPAYKSLRKIREEERKGEKPLDAHEMAAGLKHYAGIGDEYIRILRRMMKDNEALLEKAME